MNLNKESAYLDTISRYAKREQDFLNQIGELREKLFNQAREIRMQIEEENKNKAANNETFQRGEWVYVMHDGSHLGWIKAIYICEIPGEYKPFVVVSEDWNDCFLSGKKFKTERFDLIHKMKQQPQKPKNTVLKAPAMCKDVNHLTGKIETWATVHIFKDAEEAKEHQKETFHSFPARIRMKDGTEQELWFVCEEEL